MAKYGKKASKKVAAAMRKHAQRIEAPQPLGVVVAAGVWPAMPSPMRGPHSKTRKEVFSAARVHGAMQGLRPWWSGLRTAGARAHQCPPSHKSIRHIGC